MESSADFPENPDDAFGGTMKKKKSGEGLFNMTLGKTAGRGNLAENEMQSVAAELNATLRAKRKQKSMRKKKKRGPGVSGDEADNEAYEDDFEGDNSMDGMNAATVEDVDASSIPAPSSRKTRKPATEKKNLKGGSELTTVPPPESSPHMTMRQLPQVTPTTTSILAQQLPPLPLGAVRNSSEGKTRGGPQSPGSGSECTSAYLTDSSLPNIRSHRSNLAA